MPIGCRFESIREYAPPTRPRPCFAHTANRPAHRPRRICACRFRNSGRRRRRRIRVRFADRPPAWHRFRHDLPDRGGARRRPATRTDEPNRHYDITLPVRGTTCRRRSRSACRDVVAAAAGVGPCGPAGRTARRDRRPVEMDVPSTGMEGQRRFTVLCLWPTQSSPTLIRSSSGSTRPPAPSDARPQSRSSCVADRRRNLLPIEC